MALPQTISCKVSSEAAGYVTTSRVVRQEMPLEELASRILGVSGKNPERVARILERGSLVSGDARYRWVPFRVAAADVSDLLERFPDHEPERPFDGGECVRMAFRGERGDFEITREVGRQRRMFRRKTFWDEVIAVVEALSPVCERYSYSEMADEFSVTLPPDALNRLHSLGGLLRFSALEAAVRALRSGHVYLYVRRT